MTNLYQHLIRVFRYLSNKCQMYLGTQPKYPISIIVGVTNRCNLRCSFCFHSSDHDYRNLRTQGVMSLDTVQKIIGDIKEKVYHVELGLFGEPFAHPQIIKIIDLFSQNGISISIFTNGILIKKRDIEALVRCRVSSITFSIDGITDEEYSQLRNTNKIDSVYHNIQLLYLEKKKNRNKGPKIFIRSLQMTDNYHSEKKMILKRFRNIAYNEVILAPKDNWNGVFADSNRTSNIKTKKCDFPWMLMSVDWDGAVIACCDDVMLKNKIGNIHQDNMLEMWGSNKIINLRKSLKTCDLSVIKKETGCADCSILKRSSHPLRLKIQLTRTTIKEMMGGSR